MAVRNDYFISVDIEDRFGVTVQLYFCGMTYTARRGQQIPLLAEESDDKSVVRFTEKKLAQEVACDLSKNYSRAKMCGVIGQDQMLYRYIKGVKQDD